MGVMDSNTQEVCERVSTPDFISSGRAVTPVIGIILMVAIAVILAAIIGTFSFVMADRVQDYAPNTRMSFDYMAGDQSGELCGLSDDDGTDEGKLTILHEEGDKIDEGRLTIVDNEGNEATWNECTSGSVTHITAGIKTIPEIDSDDTIRLVWESENNADDTAVLATYEGPDD